jgi:GNAT superfamily N-acetyltransferase
LKQAEVRVLRSGCYDRRKIADWSGPVGPREYEKRIKESVILVAQEEEEILGFSQLEPATGNLRGLYGDPLHVEFGFGSTLLHRSEARARSARLMTVEVEATLKSRGFYESCGYISRGHRRSNVAGAVELDCFEIPKKL